MACARVTTAISAPEFPEPTTRTSRPRYGSAFLYADECSSSPENDAAPGQSGCVNGEFVGYRVSERPGRTVYR